MHKWLPYKTGVVASVVREGGWGVCRVEFKVSGEAGSGYDGDGAFDG